MNQLAIRERRPVLFGGVQLRQRSMDVQGDNGERVLSSQPGSS